MATNRFKGRDEAANLISWINAVEPRKRQFVRNILVHAQDVAPLASKGDLKKIFEVIHHEAREVRKLHAQIDRLWDRGAGARDATVHQTSLRREPHFRRVAGLVDEFIELQANSRKPSRVETLESLSDFLQGPFSAFLRGP